MTLREYLDVERGRLTRLAALTGVNIATLSRIANSHRSPTLAQMRAIQIGTGGAVTAVDWLPITEPTDASAPPLSAA